MNLLIEIYAWSIPGNLHHRCRSTHQNCAMDENGHKARQHDKNLEHICPDHSFHATLEQIVEETGNTWLRWLRLESKIQQSKI